jgi:hypothetical protein
MFDAVKATGGKDNTGLHFVQGAAHVVDIVMPYRGCVLGLQSKTSYSYQEDTTKDVLHPSTKNSQYITKLNITPYISLFA